MYVRWKRHVRQNRGRAGKDCHYEPKRREYECLCAVLVQSRRIDGKPRQKVVRYLAGVQRADLESESGRVGASLRFWRRVRERLVGLELTPEELAAVEAGLARVVPELAEE